MGENKNTQTLTGGRTADSKFNFGEKGWGLVIIAMLSYVLYMGFDNALNYIAPAYSEVLGVSNTMLLLFSTIGGWVSVVAIAEMGVVQKKTGCKTVLLIALSLSLVGGFAWANASSVIMYALGAIMTKTFGTVFTLLSFAEIGSNWFPTKKGNYMGVITIGVVLGAFVANGPVGTMITMEGPRAGIMLLVIINVLVLILSAVFVRNFPEEAGANPDNDKDMTPEQAKRILETVKEYQRTSSWTVGVCLRNRTVWFAGIAFGLLLCIAQGLMSQTVSAAISMGHSAATAQMVALSFVPFAFISTILTGKLDQKLGTKKVTVIIFIIAIIGCLVGGLLGKNIVGIIIGCVLVASAVSGGNNLLMSMCSTIWGRVDFSTPYVVALTICQMISAFGYVLVSGLAGLAETYIFAFMGGAVVIFVGLFFAIAISDKMLGRTKEDVVEGAFGE